MALEIKTVMQDQAAEITLSGEMDYESAEKFEQELRTVSVNKPAELRLIMRDLKYLSSRGIRALLLAKQQLMPGGVVFRLIDPPVLVLDALVLARLVHEVIIR